MLSAVALAAMLVAVPLGVGGARAADAAGGAATTSETTSQWTISGGATLTSDYVFRGFTQTRENAAIQPWVELGYGLFYLGVWGSNVDFGAVPPTADVEVDFYAGIRPMLGPAEFDLGVIYYTYPGASDLPGGEFNYVEIKAAASVPVTDMLTASATIFYSPEFFGEVGAAAAFEGALEIALPHDFAISGTLGRQTFSNNVLAGANYTYWNIGASWTYEMVTLDVRYWDTNLPGAACANVCDERVVGSISVEFSSN